MERDEDSRRGQAKRQRAGRAREDAGEVDSGNSAVLPDLLRRAMALGLSGLFTTEEALRKALGETLPQDWVDFAALHSDRARAEFLDRLVAEFGRVLENVDLGQLMEQTVEGRTIEISAQIRFGPRTPTESTDTERRQPELSIRTHSDPSPRAGAAEPSRATTAGDKGRK